MDPATNVMSCVTDYAWFLTQLLPSSHEPGGWQYLARQIKAQTCRQLRIVFGMVDDKDINGVMSLLPTDAIYYWTQPSSKRALPVAQVQQLGIAHDLKGQSYPTVGQAYRTAIADADDDDFVFVGGSSYVVSDLLAINDF